ncbi:MAG: hypothetical protein KA792_10430, partial [Bacteroidales bacterium]|nr:hypothetical protein [Bacteroidales bacterium]
MENNKFNRHYSKKTVSELLGQLRTHRITGVTLDKDWYEGLVTHLRERDLTQEESNIFNHILSAETIILNNEEKQEELLKEKEYKEVSKIFFTEKYLTLRTISKILIAFGFIVGLVTIIGTIFFLVQGKEGIIFGVLILVIGTLITLGVITIAESIKVI